MIKKKTRPKMKTMKNQKKYNNQFPFMASFNSKNKNIHNYIHNLLVYNL